MTKGNITKILFQFAAPLVASRLLQQLYNIADSMIAGNFIGENAVAAIPVMGDRYNAEQQRQVGR